MCNIRRDKLPTRFLLLAQKISYRFWKLNYVLHSRGTQKWGKNAPYYLGIRSRSVLYKTIAWHASQTWGRERTLCYVRDRKQRRVRRVSHNVGAPWCFMRQSWFTRKNVWWDRLRERQAGREDKTEEKRLKEEWGRWIAMTRDIAWKSRTQWRER